LRDLRIHIEDFPGGMAVPSAFPATRFARGVRRVIAWRRSGLPARPSGTAFAPSLIA
jgi:hypothetical protein